VDLGVSNLAAGGSSILVLEAKTKEAESNLISYGWGNTQISFLIQSDLFLYRRAAQAGEAAPVLGWPEKEMTVQVRKGDFSSGKRWGGFIQFRAPPPASALMLITKAKRKKVGTS
jgi:hypothetical protein